jgi:hypothetical protein
VPSRSATSSIRLGRTSIWGKAAALAATDRGRAAGAAACDGTEAACACSGVGAVGSRSTPPRVGRPSGDCRRGVARRRRASTAAMPGAPGCLFDRPCAVAWCGQCRDIASRQSRRNATALGAWR